MQSLPSSPPPSRPSLLEPLTFYYIELGSAGLLDPPAMSEANHEKGWDKG